MAGSDDELLVDEREEAEDTDQGDENPAERRKAHFQELVAYFKSFSFYLHKAESLTVKELTEDQKQKLQKKTRELEDAFGKFFIEIDNKCLNLNRLAEDKELSDETVAEIFKTVHATLIELIGKPVDLKALVEKPVDGQPIQGSHDYYQNPAKLISLQSKAKGQQETVKPKVTSLQIINHVESRVNQLKKDCYQLLDQDYAKHGWYAPQLAKVERVAGIAVATLLAAVAGAAIMFALGNYSDMVFAANVAQTISSQLGLFVAPGLLAGVGGFAASYHRFFKTGSRAKTDRIAGVLGDLMKARLQYAVTAAPLLYRGKTVDAKTNEEAAQDSVDTQETGRWTFFLQWCGLKYDEQGLRNIESLYPPVKK